MWSWLIVNVFLCFYILSEGDLKNKLKKDNKLLMNNTKVIGNSFQGNHKDNRIENDYLHNRPEEDTLR